MRRPARAPGRVRIISGKWRGRRLEVGTLEGLRPTPDRLRETLFNWLSPVLRGSVCLDLFAGSGALGLEAASRGAAQVVMVERDAACARALGAQLEVLQADTVRLVRADAIEWLRTATQRFGIVFLDPPYASDILARSSAMLARAGLLETDALVYLEQDARTARLQLPEGWTVHRESRAGQALGVLARVTGR